MPFIRRLGEHVITCCWNVIIICYGLEMCYDITYDNGNITI